MPGPNFKGDPESAAADSNDYNRVDTYDSFGLGRNIPIATGNLSDSLLFLQDGRWVTLRVPYPMGFFVKQIDGRKTIRRPGGKAKAVDRVGKPPDLALRGRQGHAAEARETAAAPESAREITGGPRLRHRVTLPCGPVVLTCKAGREPPAKADRHCILDKPGAHRDGTGVAA